MAPEQKLSAIAKNQLIFKLIYFIKQLYSYIYITIYLQIKITTEIIYVIILGDWRIIYTDGIAVGPQSTTHSLIAI